MIWYIFYFIGLIETFQGFRDLGPGTLDVGCLRTFWHQIALVGEGDLISHQEAQFKPTCETEVTWQSGEKTLELEKKNNSALY